MVQPGRFEKQCDDIAARCALHTVRQLGRALARHYDAYLAPAGLRGTQFNVLVAIARARGADMTTLGRRLGLDRTGLTHALRALARDGLVESLPGSDRRRRELRLTPLGRKRVAAAMRHWAAAQRAIELGVSKPSWAVIAVPLRRLSRRIESARA